MLVPSFEVFGAMLSQSPNMKQTRPGQYRAALAAGSRRRYNFREVMSELSEHGKCPMGKHPWLATFFVLAFVLVFLAHKLGLL
jgi:hypothetical protein